MVLIRILFFFTVRYEIAEDCADDEDASSAISELKKAALKELKMHNSIVEVRFGACRPSFFFLYFLFFRVFFPLNYFVGPLAS